MSESDRDLVNVIHIHITAKGSLVHFSLLEQKQGLCQRFSVNNAGKIVSKIGTDMVIYPRGLNIFLHEYCCATNGFVHYKYFVILQQRRVFRKA